MGISFKQGYANIKKFEKRMKKNEKIKLKFRFDHRGTFTAPFDGLYEIDSNGIRLIDEKKMINKKLENKDESENR